MAKEKTTKNDAATQAAKYAKLRQKAIDKGAVNGTPTVITDKPYILGEEYGFTPELHIPVPNLESLIVFQTAAADGMNVWEITRALLGPNNAVRLIRVIDENFDVAAAEATLSGVLLDVMEHFFGPGAGEVRGGFTF